MVRRGSQRLQPDRRARGKPRGRKVAEERANLRDRRRGIDVARDDIDGVVRVVPSLVEAAYLRGGDGVREVGDRAQPVLGVRRSADQPVLHPHEQTVKRVAVVLLHLLRDGAAFLIPLIRRNQQSRRAGTLRAQRDVQIRRGDRENVARHRGLRLRVEIAARDADGIHELRGRQRRAPAEHHVFRRVRQPRDPLLVGAHLDSRASRSRPARAYRVRR